MVDEDDVGLDWEEWLKENSPFAGPYEFARDREIERKIANDNKRRESEEGGRGNGQD